ncbi:MAG TPA: DUF4184 family protein [Steroidobacteraceae bacterium]|nr:DUF4184 family protein [Steroidobacteraceae bacterium]
MPFTISHAAAVLPLRKLSNARLPLAALMIGSMSPDFAYFLPGDTDRVDTHSVPGLFWFCWPISLALWLLFVRVLEQPTSALLPENWRTRFAPSDREISRSSLSMASAAVLLGAVTHLVWDGFTHRGTAIVDIIPALKGVAFYYNGWRVRWFVVLQHLSSGAGLLLLAIWAWRLPAGRYPRPPGLSVSNATRVLSAVILIAASSGFAIASFVYYSDTWVMRRLFHFAIGGMTGWAAAWLAIAVALNWRARPAVNN